jgi:hypothetical protein
MAQPSRGVIRGFSIVLLSPQHLVSRDSKLESQSLTFNRCHVSEDRRWGYDKLNPIAILLSNLNQNSARYGVNSVALVHRQELICSKLLKCLVPRAGVEPARPYGQRILSPLLGDLPHSTTRYQAVFTDVSAVKASHVWLGIST